VDLSPRRELNAKPRLVPLRENNEMTDLSRLKYLLDRRDTSSIDMEFQISKRNFCRLKKFFEPEIQEVEVIVDSFSLPVFSKDGYKLISSVKINNTEKSYTLEDALILDSEGEEQTKKLKNQKPRLINHS